MFLLIGDVHTVMCAQTEEAKHQANKNTGSGESLGDKASHASNVVGNKVFLLTVLTGLCAPLSIKGRAVSDCVWFVVVGSGDKAQCPERSREISS